MQKTQVDRRWAGLRQREIGRRPVDLRDYLKVLKRRWIVIALSGLLAVGAAAVVTLQTTPQYASTVRLFVSVPESDAAAAYQGGLFSEQRAASYADLVTGPELADRVVDRLDLDQDAESLGNQITATVVPKTVILNVTVTDPDRIRASMLAGAVGREFVAFVGELETSPGAKSSRPAIKASILGVPRTPDQPVSPQPVRNIGIAALLGVLLGVGIAALRESLDTTLRSADDLANLADAPVLGSIPFDPEAKEKKLITSLEPHAPRVEAFKVLRTNLQFVGIDQPNKIFVVTSSVPGDGKTTNACNLAATLAQAGQRVVLVEADLRRPRVGEYTGLESALGLTTVLIGRTRLESAIQRWGPDGIPVLTSGVLPPDPAELLHSRALAELLAKLREHFDSIIIDAPPLLPVTDAGILATQADGTLLVVRYGKTTHDQIRGSVARLNSVNARLIGTLLNRSPQKGDGGKYGYGYGYGTGYAPVTRRRRADSDYVRQLARPWTGSPDRTSAQKGGARSGAS
ncbi:polysaccharide biosynthesis tyrosine autokinase [Actinopolymorpha sp. B9G3]|uniref:polysaccharide biosynthesis tyrosine autokinase n=1 Tax=Actinopolymorpha sp. B9G3 TaxID=3158970 RepID=UPI0032D91B4C